MSEAFGHSLRRWIHTPVEPGRSIVMADAVPNDRQLVSDETLIEQILAGDREAFDRLYERYFGRVYSFVRKRLDNRADVEETVQEVFIGIFSCLDSYRREAPLGAWILGIARRAIAGRFKKKRHPTVPLTGEEEPETVDLPMPMLQRTATPFDYYECRERIYQLEAAAARQLTRDQRRMFELHHLHHRSIADIAEQLKKSEDAVKSNLYRARKALLAG
jgi:RNA polymerase sigma-70 factor (ECF subfamily)